MPWSDDEMQSLMGNAPAVEAPLSGLPDLSWGQTLEKRGKQIANIVPQTANILFQDTVGAYGAIRPDQVAQSDITAAGLVAPKFDVGPSTGLTDVGLNTVIPQIASWALPYGEISKGVKALGMGGILAEGLAQGGANALSAAGEGTQGNPVNSGILGASSGIVQAALPRWQRALPLAAISALDYAHTGNAWEAGGNFVGNMLPGAFKASNVTAAKLAPNTLDEISSGLGLNPQSIESPIQSPITPATGPIEPSGLQFSPNQEAPLAPLRTPNGIPFDTADTSGMRTTPFSLEPTKTLPVDTTPSGLSLAEEPTTPTPSTPLDNSGLQLDRSDYSLNNNSEVIALTKKAIGLSDSPLAAINDPDISGFHLEGQSLQQQELNDPLFNLQSKNLDPNINFKLIDDPNAIRPTGPVDNTGDLLSWKPTQPEPQKLLGWNSPEDLVVPKTQAPSLASDSVVAPVITINSKSTARELVAHAETLGLPERDIYDVRGGPLKKAQLRANIDAFKASKLPPVEDIGKPATSLNDAINSVISKDDATNGKKIFISDVYQRLQDSGKFNGSLQDFKTALQKDIPSDDRTYAITRQDFPPRNLLSEEEGIKYNASTMEHPFIPSEHYEQIQGDPKWHDDEIPTVKEPVIPPKVQTNLPDIMTPSGSFMDIQPRQDGPHIISTALDSGEGQYLSGANWNDPHMKGENNIFEQQLDNVTGNEQSKYIVQDAQGNIKIADRVDAGKIADISGQRILETIGTPLQSEHLVDAKPIEPVIPEQAVVDAKADIQTENSAIEQRLRQAVIDAKSTGGGIPLRKAARELQEFLEATKPTEAEAAQQSAASLVKGDISMGGAAKGMTRSLRQGMFDMGQSGQISPETMAVIAIGGIAGVVAYQQSKQDIGSTLAATVIAMGLGALGIKAIKALRASVGPEGKLVSTKVPDATLLERMRQFAKDTSQTKGGMAIYGRGGITANAVRMAEGLAGLNGTPFFRDAKILADGFIAHQLDTLSQAMNDARAYNPASGFQEASGKFLEGRLANQAAVDAVIRNGGGIDSDAFEKLTSAQKSAYPEKWFVTNDLRNTQGIGTEVFRVTNSAKSTLVKMQKDALNALVSTADDGEFAKMMFQARETIDNLMQVVHDALPPGQQRNKVLGTMGQYMSRTYALLTDPNHYPTENEIQNAMGRLASNKEDRFLKANATNSQAVGSVSVNYNGQQYFLSPVDKEAFDNLHTPESLRSLVAQYIQQIKQVAKGRAQGLVTADTAQIGNSLFSGRKELDDVTQALLGIHDAPLDVIQNTMNKLVPTARASHFMSSLITMADERTGLSHAYTSEIEYNKAVNDIKQQLRIAGSPRETQQLQTKLQELSSYIPISGSDPKFGIFQGSYVSRMAADQLKGYNGPFGILDNAIGKGMSNFNQLVKDTHLVLNPVTQVRNIMQIPMFLAMGKAAANPDAWMSAIEALKNPLSDVGQRLTLNGVFAGNPVHGEFNEGMMNLKSLLSGDTDRSIWGMLKKGKGLVNQLYSMPDNFVRASVYLAEEARAAKKFGVSVDAMDPRVMEQARMFMSRRTLDYANVPTWVKMGRQIPFVSMYLSYTHEILRVAKNMAVDALHGDLHAGATLAGIASLPFLLQNAAENKLSPKDLHDWQMANAVSAPYSRYRFKLPMSRNSNGSFNYLDITPLSHFSDFQMAGRALAHKDLPAVGAVNPFFGTDNTPLLSLLSEQITGQDAHTGRTYRNAGDRALAIAREIVPPHTPGIGYEYIKDMPESFGGDLGVTNLKNGRTNTIEGAISRHLTGVDYTQVDPGLAEKSFVGKAKEEIANERQYLMDTLKTNGLSADAKKRATDRFVEAVHHITNEMHTRLQLIPNTTAQ